MIIYTSHKRKATGSISAKKPHSPPFRHFVRRRGRYSPAQKMAGVTSAVTQWPQGRRLLFQARRGGRDDLLHRCPRLTVRASLLDAVGVRDQEQRGLPLQRDIR
ncbi:hypothetical protein SAY86_003888 [Trapa natans]|uniref:Uncharacterized protein n=1 Tax=Trapa natans TaxID=22666 RepID=A0AAN7MHT5_TRANT|nr:hypothetical protein SAY86_003888 [Trapa natans]